MARSVLALWLHGGGRCLARRRRGHGMSRTALCVITAAGLVVASLTLMSGRCLVLGAEVKTPLGPGTWSVTLLVQGQTLDSDARLTTAVPLEVGHQHVQKEECHSKELLPRPP